MQIPYPRRVQVGGKTYTIKIDPHLMVREGSVKGQCDYVTQSITIQSGYTPDSMTEVVIHEICHVLNATYCAGNITEDELNSLSEGLFQVWKQLGIEALW